MSADKVETSLIEQFIYPKYGPGQLWETVAQEVINRGGRIEKESEVVRVNVEDGRVVSVVCRRPDGSTTTVPCDYLLSTMPIKDLVEALSGIVVPDPVRSIAAALPYRDFITVGVCTKKLRITNQTKIRTWQNRVPDTWIYVQERDVKVGRPGFLPDKG